jgi:hypothetical protein
VIAYDRSFLPPAGFGRGIIANEPVVGGGLPGLGRFSARTASPRSTRTKLGNG